jgi:hypothetical protein
MIKMITNASLKIIKDLVVFRKPVDEQIGRLINKSLFLIEFADDFGKLRDDELAQKMSISLQNK